jgi:hopene-associated glycosyltransferase HpnB
MTALVVISLIGWIYLVALHGRRFWQPLQLTVATPPGYWPSVTIIVPARNEATELPQTLPSLLQQDYAGNWRIVLVDDESKDGTADIARKIAAELGKTDRLTVVTAPEPKNGWSGKVAAMQYGLDQTDDDFVMFTDADIQHPADNLSRLVAQAETNSFDLVSLMVKLHCQSSAEKLLIPAFVYFFQMLYPFRWANDVDCATAAAAGGVMLVRKTALNAMNGLSAMRGAMIDDCALAELIKHKSMGSSTARTSLTLSADTISSRAYGTVRPIWDMIARTAFTQLKHSIFLLLTCILGMVLLFAGPVLGIVFGDWLAVGLSLITLGVMSSSYLPLIKFYGLKPTWALTLPAAAMIYMGATLDSARQSWLGRGGAWKDRTEDEHMRLGR